MLTPPQDQIELSRARFSQKFRLCFRKEEVQSDIRELRDFVSDFEKLTSEIIEQLRDLDINKPSSESLNRRTATYWNDLERYRQIRTASVSLYDTFTFRWSCATHQQHVAIISLKDEGSRETKQPRKSSVIRFNAMISPTTPESSPLWLEIEHVNVTTDKDTGACGDGNLTTETKPSDVWTSTMETLQKNAQRSVTPPDLPRIPKKLIKRPPSVDQAPRKKKVVQFLPILTAVSQRTAVLSKIAEHDDTAVSEEPPVRNLGRIAEFCSHFEANTSNSSSMCIGYLRHTGIYRFYPPAAPSAPISNRKKNLFDVISWIAEDDSSRVLPRTATFHLARELASAVLQYHSTPWLPQIWYSSHVQLFGIDEVLQDPENLHLPSPYFQAAFSQTRLAPEEDRPDTTGTSQSSSHQARNLMRDLANARFSRNRVLFCLGIVFLELGYGKTWPRLRQSVTAKLSPDHTDYQAAMSLSKSRVLKERMGLQYPSVVEKCLGCDFARGDDLGSQELQGAFLVDVVNVLREEERKLSELHKEVYNL